MPSAPELLDGQGGIGIVEILFPVESQHTAQSDGHIGVTGEVIINLESVGNHSQPGQRRTKLACFQRPYLVRHISQSIGNEYFFPHPETETFYPVQKIFPCLGPPAQRRGDIAVLYDGSCDELGKQGDIQGEIQDVGLGRDRIPVDVHHIGHGLESEKGDTDGQYHLGNLQRSCPLEREQFRQKTSL